MKSVNNHAQPAFGGACCRPGRQLGFSLIELMVAITISLLMMAAILQLFLDVSHTNDEMAKTNAQIENGRFALQLIADDVVHGGFWDGFIPAFDDLTSSAVPADYPIPYPATPALAPAPCTSFGVLWDSAYKTALLGIPVQAYDTVPTGCSTVVTGKKAATDVLVVRHAATTTTASADFDENDVYFQPSFCSASAYDYWLGSKSAFTDFNWKKRDPASATDGCGATALQADIRKYVSNIYYVKDITDSDGDVIPTLMRAEFDNGAMQAAQPLVEGVERFSVELGVDDHSDSGALVNYAAAVTWANPLNKTSPTNRGDGAPDGAFVRCSGADGCTVDELTGVVAVKLYLVVRSLEATPGYTDSKTYCLGAPSADGSCPAAKQFTPSTAEKKYKRHLYSTTVRLINVSARRETP